MIDTFYALNVLDSPNAFIAALIVGFFFGLFLERAGFGSSRRLSGIFYFKDMSVLKVMFTALITAMLGLNIFMGIGLIDASADIYFMPTFYGAAVIAGLIFGVGFVMGGWCPGTSIVGLASGKLDALIFIVGAVAGSILYNEFYPVVKSLASWGMSTQNAYGMEGVSFIHETLGMSKAVFAFLFTIIAVVSFWGAEWIEKLQIPSNTNHNKNSRFLKKLSVLLVVIAAGLMLVPGSDDTGVYSKASALDKQLLAQVENAQDHMDPEDLADALLKREPTLVVVDVRPPEEYASFHIRGAVNVPLPELPAFMAQEKPENRVVLYSNGMTHPAQARDALYRMGYRHVFMLTDGIIGFRKTCLKPVSLRSHPLSSEAANRVNAWRAYFLADETSDKTNDRTEGPLSR